MSLGLDLFKAGSTIPEGADGTIRAYYGYDLATAVAPEYGDYYVKFGTFTNHQYAVYRYEDATQSNIDTLSWYRVSSDVTVSLSDYIRTSELLGRLTGTGVFTVFYSDVPGNSVYDVKYTSNALYEWDGAAWVAIPNDWRTWYKVYNADIPITAYGGEVKVSYSYALSAPFAGGTAPTYTVASNPNNKQADLDFIAANITAQRDGMYLAPMVYEMLIRFTVRVPQCEMFAEWLRVAITVTDSTLETLTADGYNALIAQTPGSDTQYTFDYTVVTPDPTYIAPVYETEVEPTVTAVTSTKTHSLAGIDDIDVIPLYTSLMKAATSRDSLYIKAKESMVEYFASPSCILSEREKADSLVQLVSTMAVQMTNASLTAAVDISKSNREGKYEIAKLIEETIKTKEETDVIAAQNLKLGYDILDKESDKDLKVIQGWKLQSDMIRDNGLSLTGLTTNIKLLTNSSVSDTGIKYAQEKQTDAATHATLAKSLREAGNIGWSSYTPGAVTAVTGLTSGTDTDGLTAAQTNVAIRQEKGFDDNMLQHVVNSSASFMGLLLSGDQSAIAGQVPGSGIVGGAVAGSPIDIWNKASNDMLTRSSVTAG